MATGVVHELLTAATTAPITGSFVANKPSDEKNSTKIVQVNLDGTGAVSATVLIEGSNKSNVASWPLIATITISGTTTAVDSFTFDIPWRFTRARITAISGTSAVVNVTQAV